MLCALLKNEYLFFKYFFNDLRYGKKFKQIQSPEDEIFKHCKNSVIKNSNMCTVKKPPLFSLYLGNENRFRKKICGFEIPEKR